MRPWSIMSGRHGDCATRAPGLSTVASASSTITYEFQKAPTLRAPGIIGLAPDQLPVLEELRRAVPMGVGRSVWVQPKGLVELLRALGVPGHEVHPAE